jgi:hypothetical protein
MFIVILLQDENTPALKTLLFAQFRDILSFRKHGKTCGASDMLFLFFTLIFGILHFWIAKILTYAELFSGCNQAGFPVVLMLIKQQKHNIFGVAG